MWTYHQLSGELIAHDGTLVARGYSGMGEHKNRPASQYIKALGPIPVGTYRIGAPRNSPNVGPYALALDPLPGTDTHGRGDFRIHGDSRTRPGQASHGCLIFSKAVRIRVWESGDHELEVK